MRNNFLNLVAYDPIAEPCAAKMPQNTGGGNSRTKNRSVTVNLSSDTTTNREMTERRPREDRETFVLRSSLLGTLKYVACMLLALVLGVGNMWATDTFVNLRTVDFTAMTKKIDFANGKNTISDAGYTDVEFYQKNTDKPLKLNNASGEGIDFSGQNIGNSHFVAIPLTGINGQLKVTVFHKYNSGKASFKLGLKTGTTTVTPGDYSTNAQTPKDGANADVSCSYTYGSAIIGTATTAVLFLGEAGTSYTQIKKVVIETLEAPSCSEPAAPTISGTESYTEGQTITLTASHDGDNHGESTTYTWYKGDNWDAAKVTTPVQAAATGSSGYTFTKANCVTGDAGTYWCEAANSTCKSHNETGKTITVSESALPEVDAPTELSSTAQTATSLTFGWTAAENASSYDVYLYSDEGCLSLATPTESNPQNVTTVSATFTGLTVSTTYYCKVQSKGDGTSYKVNGKITATAASAETPCTAITPTWVYPFTKIAVGITPSNPVDGNLGEGAVSYSSSATAAIDPSNAHWAKAAGSAKITADVAAAGNYCSGSVTSGTIEVVADQTGIITQGLATGNTAWNASTPTTTDETNITNLVALHAEGEGYTISGNGNGNNGGQTAKVPSVNASSCNDTKYLEMSFKVAAGKRLNVSAIYIPVQPVTSDAGKFKAILSDGTTEIEGTVSNIPNGKLDYIRFTSFGTVQGDVTLRIYAWNWNAGYRMGRNVIIAGEIETIPVSSYDITYTEPSDGSYTIQVGEAAAVSANTTANNGETITLAATPASGYRLKAWDVYKTGESTTKVSVSNNTFTMPAYAVTVSATFEAIPTVNDLVTIADDYTFTPSATIAALTLAEDNKFLAVGDGCTYGSNGLLVKENRALAFKVNNGAKVKVTFTEKDDSGTPREMQLGTAASDDDNKAYGHSGSSPATFTVTADGVVYLTASKDLSFSTLEIMYPHTVTYALGDGTGTLPTEGSHYKGEQFNVHDGETGISAPDTKEFSAWNDGISDYAGGAQYTMGSANVTLTAQWATPLPEPTITFNNGAYTIGGAALNLSTLFSSNSEGAVSYSVKTAGETGAAIDGTSFTATAAGSAVVTATQAANASYKAKSVDATITISAPSEVEGVKLVEEAVLTGNFRTSASLKDQERTIKGITYSKYINLSSRSSWGSQPAGPDNYLLQYTLTKKTNTFYFYAYNKNSGGKSIKVYVKEEGENVVTKTVDIAGSTGALLSCEVNVTKNAEVLISHTSTDVQICQVVVVESGDELLLAPAVNYNISFNKGRLTAKQNTAKTFEGMTYCNNADYKIDNSGNLKLTTRGTHYVSFEIPAGQTRQLQVTAGGGAYNVSKVLGDDKKATVTGNNNINLGAGTWYINPQGSDVTITNLKFVAAPASMTIAFNSNGGSDVESQLLFVGDKVAEPEAPTKSGFRLVKWQKDGADYDFDYTLVAGDAPGFTLDAVWQETVTVTFNPGNGEDTFTKTTDKGELLAVADRPAEPEYAGHDFLGWTANLSDDPMIMVDFALNAFATDVTLYAAWREKEDDPSLSALAYDGNAIDLASGVDQEGVLTFAYVLPYKGEYEAAKLVPTKAASSATLSDITYTPATKTATFRVTSLDGPYKDYAVVFSNAAKDMLCLIKGNVGNDTFVIDEAASLFEGTTDKNNVKDDSSNYDEKTGWKLKSRPAHLGITLSGEETFQEGDVVEVFVTSVANISGANDKMRIFDANAATSAHVLRESVDDMIQGVNRLVLPATTTKSLYLHRSKDGDYDNFNPFVAYVAVYRPFPVPEVKAITFNGAAGVVGDATITATIPYSTDLATMPVVVSFLSNDPEHTSGAVTSNGGTWVEGDNTYVVTDKDGDTKTYTVTLTRAAVSHDASLTALSIAGYSIDFDPAVMSYDVELPYGSVIGDLPVVSYTAASGATAVKTDATVLPGNTVIEVTAEDESTIQDYTIHFTVNRTPVVVLYDGSTMDAIAENGSVLGLTWSITDANTLSATSAAGTFEGKDYAKEVNLFTSATKGEGEGDTRYITITIPEDYIAKFRLVGTSNSSGSDASANRSLFISKTKTGTLDKSIAYATSMNYNTLAGMTSDFQLPGVYYLCADKSIRLYELSVQLYPIDYTRDVTEGRFGTICLPNGGVMVGAELYEVAYKDPSLHKIFFDQIVSGEMIAGRPYIFLPKEGTSQLAVFYTDASNAEAGNYHGLYGSYTEEPIADGVGNYILSNNQYREVQTGGVAYVTPNRAYFKYSEIPGSAMAPMPGRKRMSIGAAAPAVTTGMDELNASEAPVKVMIDGQLFIIRGEKMYNANGQLVK